MFVEFGLLHIATKVDPLNVEAVQGSQDALCAIKRAGHVSF